MELRRLDPDHGGASVVELHVEENTFLGRNPIAQITDTVISRKQVSVFFDKKDKRWKLKTLIASKLCYFKKFNSNDWTTITDEIELSTGDQISLTKDKYIYECFFNDVSLTVENDTKNPTNNFVESEKSKCKTPNKGPSLNDYESSKPCTPSKEKKRVLPAWMLDSSDDDKHEAKVPPKNKKDTKTPTKQERKRNAATNPPKRAQKKDSTKTETTPGPSKKASPRKKKVKASDFEEEGVKEKDNLPKVSPSKSLDSRANHDISDSEEDSPINEKASNFGSKSKHEVSDSEEETEEKGTLTAIRQNISDSEVDSKDKNSLAAVKQDVSNSEEDSKDKNSFTAVKQAVSSPGEDIKDINSLTALKAAVKHDVSDSEDESALNGSETDAKDGDSELKVYSSEPVRAEEPKGGASHAGGSASVRRSCAYGSGCYRKNPQHRVDKAHPGDPDYKDPNVDDDASDTRPECEYGLTCYRKNPQHRIDFKHTAKPVKPKRAKKSPKKRAKKAKQGSGSESESFESSFIDDDTDEEDLTPDESDEEEWLPSTQSSD